MQAACQKRTNNSEVLVPTDGDLMSTRMSLSNGNLVDFDSWIYLKKVRLPRRTMHVPPVWVGDHLIQHPFTRQVVSFLYIYIYIFISSYVELYPRWLLWQGFQLPLMGFSLGAIWVSQLKSTKWRVPKNYNIRCKELQKARESTFPLSNTIQQNPVSVDYSPATVPALLRPSPSKQPRWGP